MAVCDIVISERFKRDLRLSHKRGCNIGKLKMVVQKLASGEVLPPRCRDQKLSRRYKDFRECHIEPDWILVYRLDVGKRLLFLFRHGTHDDIF